MINIKINDQPFQVCYSWKDVTIERAGKLHAIKMPPALRKCYEAALSGNEKKIDEVEKEITIEDQHKRFPKYFADVLVCLSNIPEDMIQKTDIISIKTVYHTYLKQFVEGVNFNPQHDPVDIKSFDFEGETYWLPVDKKIFGQPVPMVDVSALEFAESADLMVYVSKIAEDKDLTKIANLIAILCRPQGEKYNEDVSLVRAEKFKSLDMDTVWNVFFSLITPLVILSQSVLISSLVAQIQKVKGQMN
jgi:hypothetical protein